MTDGHGMTFGAGPGGMVVPEDLGVEGDHDDRVLAPWDLEDRETLSGRLHRLEDRIGRVEGLLGVLVDKVPDRRDVNAHAAERREEFRTVRDKLLEVTVWLARFGDVPGDLARKFDVEDVLRNQRHEFGYLREHLTFLRGALSVRDPRAGAVRALRCCARCGC